jgi:hypothetical protein
VVFVLLPNAEAGFADAPKVEEPKAGVGVEVVPKAEVVFETGAAVEPDDPKLRPRPLGAAAVVEPNAGVMALEVPKAEDPNAEDAVPVDPNGFAAVDAPPKAEVDGVLPKAVGTAPVGLAPNAEVPNPEPPFEAPPPNADVEGVLPPPPKAPDGFAPNAEEPNALPPNPPLDPAPPNAEVLGPVGTFPPNPDVPNPPVFPVVPNPVPVVAAAVPLDPPPITAASLNPAGLGPPTTSFAVGNLTLCSFSAKSRVIGKFRRAEFMVDRA